MHLLSLSLSLAALPLTALATAWSVQDTYIGSSFYSGFTFQTIDDPTNGRVQYVSQSAAQSAGIVSTNSSAFVMRVDTSSVLSSSAAGRKSVRLQSNKQYTTHALIADIRHMPSGCAVWPALWTVGSNWPSGGEVDIIEGVNDVNPNLSSLHTSDGCTQSFTSTMKGTPLANDCNANVNSNKGCGVSGDSGRDFGSEFNAAGGGYFAFERTSTRMAVWFWSRADTSVPAAVKNGDSAIYTDSFGTPTAVFTSSTCPFSSKFGPHRIIINTTLCGDWAGGSAWTSSGCSSHGACISYVNNNPSAFTEAYWNIAALRVYT